MTSRSVATPGVRDELSDIEGEVPTDKEASDRYRANTMRAQNLSSDRPEVQVECRDVARKMQQPSNLDEMGLKMLARFLELRPRLVWLFKWQKRVTRTESWCHTDHAGCIRTRKSVSGCALMLDGSTVSTYCKGQAVIALSSGEAECYGLVSATSQNAWPAEYSLGLKMETRGSCLDGRHSWNCDWEPTRARTSKAHQHSVPLGASNGL